MRYRLATYRECKAHREWNTTCPDCGRRGKFSPYIDIATMRPVDDRQCGRCSRLSNCGYHLPPREMPRNEDFGARHTDSSQRYSHANLANHAKAASQKARSLSASPPTRMSVGCAERNFSSSEECSLLLNSAGGHTSDSACASRDSRDLRETKNNQREASEFYEKMRRACEQSQPWGSHLVTWLRTRFPREQVAAALKRYRVGGTPDGATLWWQIDEQGRVHTGKAMQYNPLTGHRVKEQGFPVNWAHRMRLYGEPSELVVPQCLFGEHLINVDVNVNDNCHPEDIHREAQSTLSFSSSLALQAATLPLVMLVESEKTALIMSLVCPDKVWLATGGKANFKEQMLAPLIGLEVAVYPDADALHDWYTRAVEMNRTLGTRLHIPTGYYNLMDHDEARREGWDLADILLREE